MQAITNRTGTPQWDAHGRLVPPGRIIALEEATASEDAAPGSPPAKPEDDVAPKAKPLPQNDFRAGKPGPK